MGREEEEPNIEREKEQKKAKEKAYRDILNLASLLGFLYGALDERLGLDEGLSKQLKSPAPKYRTSLENNFFACLGGISLLLIFFQIITGVLLLLYYRPTPGEAYLSITEITNQIPFGWLIRGIHVWGSHLLISLVLLHMLRVFLTGAYKPPREFTWVSGVGLLFITFFFGFTGYLLPWNQDSFWSTTVGTEFVSRIPFIGESLKIFIRGGETVGGLTLTRFFSAHVVLLPGALIIFLAIHFLMIRRLGISDPL
jgi:menaquinol-cytochrome c reductase cytochrome b subunit